VMGFNSVSKVKMNQCDPTAEYRCENGMCIAEELFLDGQVDCLDWSDEMPYENAANCPFETVTTKCDDHLCPPHQWSCGDGECIPNQLAFQESSFDRECMSGRDQYFICETHSTRVHWTMPNGRCHKGHEYVRVKENDTEVVCEYLLKCVLYRGGEKVCPCNNRTE
jgi:hypothetical protein